MFVILNDGDDDGNRHQKNNDAIITISQLSLITPPFVEQVPPSYLNLIYIRTLLAMLLRCKMAGLIVFKIAMVMLYVDETLYV